MCQGLLNVTKCYRKIPAFVSKPHFLDGDASLVNAIVNMSAPNRDLHDTVVDLEVWTGSAMEAHERLQVNVEVTPVLANKRTFFPKRERIFMPVMWLDKVRVIGDQPT